MAKIITYHTYYDFLGVSRNASPQEIHKAYRRLSRRYHPDSKTKYASAENFGKLKMVYETLRDPHKRRAYDQSWVTTPSDRQQFLHEEIAHIILGVLTLALTLGLSLFALLTF